MNTITNSTHKTTIKMKVKLLKIECKTWNNPSYNLINIIRYKKNACYKWIFYYAIGVYSGTEIVWMGKR